MSSNVEKKATYKKIVPRSGFAVGKNHGRDVRKIPVLKKYKPVAMEFRKPTLVRSVIREVSGYAAYEKRIIECLRNNLDKKALRIAKRKLGTHIKAKRKREELSRIVATQKLHKN